MAEDGASEAEVARTREDRNGSIREILPDII